MRRLLPTALLFALSLARNSGAEEVPTFVRDALAFGLGVDAELSVVEYRPTLPEGCVAREASMAGRLDGAGRGLVRLSGADGRGTACDGFAGVRAQVTLPVWVVRTAIAKGEAVGDKAERTRRPRTGADIVTELDPVSKAATALAPGTVLEPRHLVRADVPAPGTDIAVIVKDGPLTVTGKGRVVACGRDRVCAQMPGGRKVDGILRDGRLYVENR
jgi:hypothetical protein